MTKIKTTQAEFPLDFDSNSPPQNENQTYMEKNYDQKVPGSVYDWTDWKKKSLAVSKGAERIWERELNRGGDFLVAEKRLKRIKNCSDYLRFAIESLEVGSNKKLISAIFCRDRFCPHCQKRRSLVLFGQNKQLIDKWIDSFSESKAKPAFILLTLTIPNCQPEELGEKITEMLKGFNLLFKRKELDFVKGFLRTLELTRNAKRMDYHPHIHVLLGVHESYFNHKYLSHGRWLELWQQSVRRDDVQIVDVRRISGNKSSDVKADSSDSAAIAGVLETTKYCTKPSDYLEFSQNSGDYEVDDQVLEVLIRHLRGRKLVSRGRAFDKIYKELKLEDSEQVDLVKTGADEEKEAFNPMYEVLWRWAGDAGRYALSDIQEL